MTRVEDLENVVDDIFGRNFEEREGRTIPTSEDVALKNGAVKLDAAFLYADLAGSATLSAMCPWSTTAKIIRAYLDCSVRIIRKWGGEIRSFDGDRVMGVFIGDWPNTYAVKAAREIFWTTESVIQPKATATFGSISTNNIKIRQACGIDVGTVRAVRAGIRNNNDLIWVGKAASFSAKLSDLREWPYCVFVSARTYGKMSDEVKHHNGKNLWEYKSFSFAGSDETIYRTKYMLKPE